MLNKAIEREAERVVYYRNEVKKLRKENADLYSENQKLKERIQQVCWCEEALEQILNPKK